MRTVNALMLGISLSMAPVTLAWAAPSAPSGDSAAPLSLSPGLLELLRAEMRELLLGTQAIAAALPAGAWDSIVTTSQQMKASYILEKKLTPPQEKELAALPGRFRDLDQDFHARTEKLADAATRRDPEAVAYQYSRLLETCVACHTSFAPTRFPALSAPLTTEHGHQSRGGT